MCGQSFPSMHEMKEHYFNCTDQVAAEQPDHSRDATKVMPTPPIEARELVAHMTPLRWQLHDAICTGDIHDKEHCFLDGVMLTWVVGLERVITTEANRLAGEQVEQAEQKIWDDLWDFWRDPSNDDFEIEALLKEHRHG
jgi:hypothetical protein